MEHVVNKHKKTHTHHTHTHTHPHPHTPTHTRHTHSHPHTPNTHTYTHTHTHTHPHPHTPTPTHTTPHTHTPHTHTHIPPHTHTHTHTHTHSSINVRFNALHSKCLTQTQNSVFATKTDINKAISETVRITNDQTAIFNCFNGADWWQAILNLLFLILSTVFVCQSRGKNVDSFLATRRVMAVEKVRYCRFTTILFSTFLRSSSTGWSKSLCAPDDYTTIVRSTEAFWSPCSILSNVWYKCCTCTHEMQVNYNLLKISYLQTGRTAVEYQSSTAQDKKSATMLITNNWNASKHYTH